MTPAELRALLAKATPGPWEEKLEDESGHWEVRRVDGGCIAYDLGPINAALIVAAVNALPALLDIAEAAEALADVFAGSIAMNSTHGHRLLAALAKLETP